jgi:hypothetical protein
MIRYHVIKGIILVSFGLALIVLRVWFTEKNLKFQDHIIGYRLFGKDAKKFDLIYLPLVGSLVLILGSLVFLY